MQAHQLRVVEERDALADKAVKLGLFIGTDIFNGLSVKDRSLLNDQLNVMQEYLEILDARISRFN